MVSNLFRLNFKYIFQISDFKFFKLFQRDVILLKG